ncbi:uncharacterized protein LOC125073558 [Vanessa atalanta]|uniref:uncharacterized protein LOC125073558 n=1 Tax=Vanessa atalanta TaxID=42275 RepID=UPI001FCDCDD1|nr:uncharacterized protein LOC125073558 [Vanessa atalanta]
MFVWIFLSIPVISAMLDEDEFTIVRDSNEDDCKICYGFDCTALIEPRCAYYGEVYNNFANTDDYETEDNDLNEEVGNMILQYVEKASQGPHEDCLPLVSQYTNCNKENICVECKICDCDTYGRWNCSSVQHCVTDDRLVADHRTLAVVLEKVRRSFTETNTGENDIAIFSSNDVKENILNIKKRELSLDANDTNVLLPTNYNNTIDTIEELQKNVVLSLNKIVNEKQKELEKLTNIKEKLILYLKSIGNISIPNDVSNDSKYDENSIINLYQFEAKQPQEDLRKYDTNTLEKHLKKLKNDIHEVTRDIAGIQRMPNTSIPRDLIVLIRAMKYYVNKEKKKLNKIKPHTDDSYRKHLNSHDTKENNNQLVDVIINILEVLDKDAPASDVLVTVSSDLRKILKRIIRTFYRDIFDVDSEAFNPNNILIYLTTIGNKWQNSIREIEKCSIHERLYSLKSLNIALSKDILKMNNALKLMEFANNRRMAPNSEVLEEKVFKLANDLYQMKSRLKHTIKLKPYQRFKNKNNNAVKKESFFQKIKKMLKSSKKQFRKLFHKNVTKSEIVRQMARKKMDEINKKKMSEYEEIMQRWQNNLNIMSVRNKRSWQEE